MLASTPNPPMTLTSIPTLGAIVKPDRFVVVLWLIVGAAGRDASRPDGNLIRGHQTMAKMTLTLAVTCNSPASMGVTGAAIIAIRAPRRGPGRASSP